MKKLLAAFVLFSLTVWAAGFWEKKKPSEWSEKEVDKILKESPWAHAVEVPAGGGGGRGGGGGSRGGGGGGDIGGGGGGETGGGGGGLGGDSESGGGGGGGGRRGGGGGGRGGGGGGGGGVPVMSLMVRWHSALPVKQAYVRTRLGPEAATSPEAEKMLAPEANYVIAFGPLPTTMVRGDAATVKAAATLSVKGKDPIAATDVKGDRQGNAATLYLFFPRTSPITVEDNEVEFAFKLAPLNVKKKFKLKDMMYGGKLEL